jgi:hypothetical protein
MWAVPDVIYVPMACPAQVGPASGDNRSGADCIYGVNNGGSDLSWVFHHNAAEPNVN